MILADYYLASGEPCHKMLDAGRHRWRMGAEAFPAKLRQAVGIVQDALRSVRKPKAYIAFSGGKDSTAVAAIVRRVQRKIPMVWSDDELEFPQTVEMMRFLAQHDANCFERLKGTGPHGGWFYPWHNFPSQFRKPMGPLMLPELHQWEKDLGYNIVFLGTRRNESSARNKWLSGSGPIYRVKGGRVRCCPIYDWSDVEVWTLIAGWRLGYNAAYNRFERIGIEDSRWRVGPLPLVPRLTLERGWPKLLEALEATYGPRWS